MPYFLGKGVRWLNVHVNVFIERDTKQYSDLLKQHTRCVCDYSARIPASLTSFATMPISVLSLAASASGELGAASIPPNMNRPFSSASFNACTVT